MRKIAVHTEGLDEQALKALYAGLAHQRAEAAQKGKKTLLYSELRMKEIQGLEQLGALPEGTLIIGERGYGAPLDIDDIQGKELIPLRRRLCNQLLEERLATLDDAVIEATWKRVSYPILDDALGYMVRFGRTERTTEALNALEPEIGTDDHFVELLWYNRTMAFLEILGQKPEIVAQLGENSCYFPHHLFREKKEPKINPWKELEADIAEAFLSIFPSSIIDVVMEIESYITPSKETRKYHRRDRFRIPENIRMKFSDDADAAGMDELYNTPEIKRAVYTTLQRYLKMSSELSRSAELSARELKQRGEGKLGLSKTEFIAIARNVDNYIYNQILNIWLKKDLIPTPELAARRGITAISDGATLTIVDPAPYRGTQRFTKQSNPFDTTSYLPFCIAILNRIYRGAREIQAEAEQQGQSACSVNTHF